MVRVLELDALGPWARAWDRLVRLHCVPTPFLTSWWLGAQPGTAVFVLVVDGDRLLGGQALAGDRWYGVRRLRMLGQGVLAPDHLDLVAEPGAEATVVAGLREWWRGRRRTLVDLDGLTAAPLLARALGVAPVPSAVAPYAVTAEMPGEFLATRSANLRRSVRRARRRWESSGHQVLAADLPTAMRAFRALHGDRPDRAPLLAALPVLERALAAGLEAGQARLHELVRPGEDPVAVAVSFHVADRVSIYQVARSMRAEHAEAGTVLLLAVMEEAVADGVREVDLLRGDAAYKLRLSDARRTLTRVRTARGVVPRMVLGLQRLVAGMRALSATRRSPRAVPPTS